MTSRPDFLLQRTWLLVLLCLSCERAPAAPTRLQRPATAGLITRIDSAQLARLVDSAMLAGMARESIPGAAFVLVRKDRVILANGYGKADVRSGRAWDAARTIFPIASVTKVFTATAVMQLADQGRIDLNADINRYLTSLRVPQTYAAPVTAAHLLSHTAGFDEIPGRQVRSRRELMPIGQFLRKRLVRIHPPGRITSYSTYGMALAGLLVEDVSGMPYVEYLRRYIWQPLGMIRTSVTPPEAPETLATAYEWQSDSLTAIPYEVYQTPSASSILSTAEDMGHFLIAHLQNGRYGAGRILSDSTARRMHRRYATMHPLTPGWTLGFQENEVNGRHLIEHGGDIGGFSALLSLLPEDELGFFVVHHLEGKNLRFDLRQLILDRIYPAVPPPKPPGPTATDAGRLRRFAGKYRASIYCHSCRDGGPNVQEFEVTANQDGTVSIWGERWTQVGPLYFASADGRKHLGFAEDQAGRIIALTAGSWRVLERID